MADEERRLQKSDGGPPPAERERVPPDDGFGPAPFEEEDEGIPLRRYLLAVRRYKWIVLASLVLGLAGAYGAWQSVSPDFRAQGSLWVQAEDDERGPIASEGLLSSSAWIDLLRSYTVLDSVVIEHKLYLRPGDPEDLPLFDGFELADQFAPGSYRLVVSEDGDRLELRRDENVVQAAAVGDSVGGEVGFRWRPPPEEMVAEREVPFRVVTPRDAARTLSEDLTAEMDQQGVFIQLDLQGKDAERISSVLNAVMERHVDVAADLKRGNLDERTAILQEQLERVENELRTAERELESFRVQTITLPDESSPIQPGLEMTRDPVFGRYFDMQVERDELRRDRERLESVLEAQPDSGIQVEALELVPSVESSSQLQESLDDLVEARTERRVLRLRYTEEHPPVQDLTERIRRLEQETIPSQVREVIEQLESEEQQLTDRIDSSGVELSEIPTRTIEEARLRRRVAIAENLYTELRNRYEEASLAEASSIPDVRILDRPTMPEVPVNDQRMRLAMMVLAGFVGAGLAVTVLLERFDPRVRYPDQVQEEFGLPILGTIPRIRDGRRSDESLHAAHEAFRDLRTSVDYAFGSAGPLITAVSAPGAGEGKTLVTANLAISFAEMGRRTLVVDGDTRRGDLHHLLGVDRKPGLTDFLTGSADEEEIVHPTDHENLFVVGSGSRLANSPELLSSGEMGRCLAGMRKAFDVILFDSPPLAAGSDALVLGSITGHLILVLRSGSTNREMAQARMERVERLPIRVLGAVLNDFRPEGIGPYKYYGTYLPGYEVEVEDEEEVADRIASEEDG
ncbi:MAG: GumC family protein, partial [Gemmatimonadota bacterium]